MAEKMREDQRSCLGYGSSYRKAGKEDIDSNNEIKAVIGGQVWMVPRHYFLRLKVLMYE